MRLWSYQLIESGVLPNKMLVSQWRECIAIKRQWEKGTLKHRLVSYVMLYSREYFLQYVQQVVRELDKRNIKYQEKYYQEIDKFCWEDEMCFNPCNYIEHNDRYLKQCLYNLQEKADRGIITKEEWQKIEDKFGGML
ncbi:MAG: hypothetical protein IJ371_06360 [Clostridia bacterium]|nr:hypothetical protein [Clostridia bacterium]